MQSRLISQVVVATTPAKEDKEIIQIALNNDAHIFVGNPTNVSWRVLAAAKLYHADVIVRVTTDCPLIDPEIIDKTIRKVTEEGYDYAASRLNPCAYPDGFDVDVVDYGMFRYVLKTKAEPEHIMEPIKKDKKIRKASLPMEYGNLALVRKMSLDTKADYAYIKAIYDFYGEKFFRFEDIYRDFINWKTMASRTTLQEPFKVSDGRMKRIEDHYLHKVGVAPHPKMEPKGFDSAELDWGDHKNDALTYVKGPDHADHS